MKNFGLYLAILAVFLVAVSCYQCTVGEYDLSRLTLTGDNYYKIKDNDGRAYYWNICGPVAPGKLCTEHDGLSSVCQRDVTDNYSVQHTCGTTDSQAIYEMENEEGVIIKYSDGERCLHRNNQPLRSTTIKLFCSEDYTPRIESIVEYECSYTIEMYSIHACKVSNEILAAGDSPCDPIYVNTFPSKVDNNLINGLNYVSCGTSASGHSQFYRISPNFYGTVTASLCNTTSFDSILNAYSSANCDLLGSCIASSDDYCGTASQVTISVTPSQVYYFEVRPYSSSVGTYSITFTSSNSSANSTLGSTPCNPFLVPYFPYSSISDMSEGELYTSNCSSIAISQFYTFNAPSTGNVTVNTCNTTTDTILIAFSSGFCTALGACIAYNDDYCGRGAQITFPVVSNYTYYVQVRPYSSYYSSFDYNIYFTFEESHSGSSGSEPCNPISIFESGVYTNNIDNGSPYFSDCFNTYNPSVYSLFYLFTPSDSGSVNASTCGSGFDTILNVYQSINCTFLGECITSNDDSSGCSNSGSIVYFNVTNGFNYYIEVRPYSSAPSNPNFSLYFNYQSHSSGNESPCDNFYVPSLPYSFQENLADGSFYNGSCTNPVTNYAQFYYYVSDFYGNLTVSTCNPITTFDTTISIYSSPNCTFLSECIAYNDDFCGLQSQVTVNVYPGEEIYIEVSPFGSVQPGEYVVTFAASGTSGNNTNSGNVPCDAIPIESFPVTFSNNLRDGRPHRGDCDYEPSIRSQFYVVTPRHEGIITATTCNLTTMDTVINVYQSYNCSGLGTCQARNDDGCPEFFSLQSSVSIDVYADLTYYFEVRPFQLTNASDYSITFNIAYRATVLEQITGFLHSFVQYLASFFYL